MAEDHVVRQGECVMSIADERGFHWETIWQHSKNAELRRLRKDPNVLLPGDVVHIPEREEQEVEGATEQRHRFRALGVPAKLVLRLMSTPVDEEPGSAEGTEGWEYRDPNPEELEDEPLADVPYALYVDDELHAEGQTDGDGRLEENVPPGAGSGRLVLEPGTDRERTLSLNLRRMDPVSEVSGVCKRLNNLGFDCPERDEVTPDVADALRAFQSKHGLDVTGKIDDRTRDRLEELHGG